MVVAERLQSHVLAGEDAGVQRVRARRGGRPLARALQVHAVRGGETELAVQPVRVGGVQHPLKARAGAVLDHHPHDRLAETGSPVLG
jgi:hypothetical protein